MHVYTYTYSRVCSCVSNPSSVVDCDAGSEVATKSIIKQQQDAKITATGNQQQKLRSKNKLFHSLKSRWHQHTHIHMCTHKRRYVCVCVFMCISILYLNLFLYFSAFAYVAQAYVDTKVCMYEQNVNMFACVCAYNDKTLRVRSKSTAVCVFVRACEVLHTDKRTTSLRTYRNKRKCVSLYTHMYIYIHTYVYIHTRISSHRVCCFVLQCCCFFSSFFLNNNNAKSYSLSQRLSLVGEGIGGEEGDRISWKELERYANICRVNVNDELSML